MCLSTGLGDVLNSCFEGTISVSEGMSELVSTYLSFIPNHSVLFLKAHVGETVFLHEHEDWSSSPRTHAGKQGWWYTLVAPEVATAGPLELLASQPSPIGEPQIQ